MQAAKGTPYKHWDGASPKKGRNRHRTSHTKIYLSPWVVAGGLRSFYEVCFLRMIISWTPQNMLDTHTHVEFSQQFSVFVHVTGFWNVWIVVMSIAAFDEFV